MQLQSKPFPTTVVRHWTSFCWGKDESGKEVTGIGTFSETVTQHDLVVNKDGWRFWRGARV